MPRSRKRHVDAEPSCPDLGWRRNRCGPDRGVAGTAVSSGTGVPEARWPGAAGTRLAPPDRAALVRPARHLPGAAPAAATSLSSCARIGTVRLRADLGRRPAGPNPGRNLTAVLHPDRDRPEPPPTTRTSRRSSPPSPTWSRRSPRGCQGCTPSSTPLVEALDPVHRIAEAAPGFVWRLAARFRPPRRAPPVRAGAGTLVRRDAAAVDGAVVGPHRHPPDGRRGATPAAAPARPQPGAAGVRRPPPVHTGRPPGVKVPCTAVPPISSSASMVATNPLRANHSRNAGA